MPGRTSPNGHPPGPSPARRALLDAIAADAALTARETGRAELSPRVMEAIARVPREAFVPAEVAAHADENRPLPIGHGQTISQPFVVALMTDLLDLRGHERVLEVGTGSGYQAAVLAMLAREVYGVEVVPELAAAAAGRLARLGHGNVRVRTGDGALGWPEAAPFDAVIVTAGAPAIPPALLQQLAPGGRLVAPVGPDPGACRLVVATRGADGRIEQRAVLDVAFVPLVTGSGPRTGPAPGHH